MKFLILVAIVATFAFTDAKFEKANYRGLIQTEHSESYEVFMLVLSSKCPPQEIANELSMGTIVGNDLEELLFKLARLQIHDADLLMENSLGFDFEHLNAGLVLKADNAQTFKDNLIAARFYNEKKEKPVFATEATLLFAAERAERALEAVLEKESIHSTIMVPAADTRTEELGDHFHPEAGCFYNVTRDPEDRNKVTAWNPVESSDVFGKEAVTDAHLEDEEKRVEQIKAFLKNPNHILLPNCTYLGLVMIRDIHTALVKLHEKYMSGNNKDSTILAQLLHMADIFVGGEFVINWDLEEKFAAIRYSVSFRLFANTRGLDAIFEIIEESLETWRQKGIAGASPFEITVENKKLKSIAHDSDPTKKLDMKQDLDDLVGLDYDELFVDKPAVSKTVFDIIDNHKIHMSNHVTHLNGVKDGDKERLKKHHVKHGRDKIHGHH